MPLESGVSDELLVKRAADGSDTAFEELMGRYMRVIYSYIALRASAFDGESTLKTWLFAIARRKIAISTARSDAVSIRNVRFRTGTNRPTISVAIRSTTLRRFYPNGSTSPTR